MKPVVLDRTLQAMFDELYAADKLYWPSPFWTDLNQTQIRQLEEHGLEQFKRTVNLRYFAWSLKGIVAHQLLPVLSHWAAHPDVLILSKMKFAESTSRAKSPILSSLSESAINRAYALYVLLLKHYVVAQDRLGLFQKISEPLDGNPWVVESAGMRVSQDVCNSIHEFYSATRGVTLDNELNVTELGAGYGRVGFVFLHALKSCKYTVIDIPPALYVSQSYLPKVFPEAKVFYFRPFSSYREIEKEFESSQIRFIGAHQIKLLPPKSVDIFLNISSLHEMTMEQIRFYLEQIDRLTRSHFYMKQWRRSRSPDNGFRIKECEYPIPSAWKAVYHERHPLQRMFFHALYNVPS